MATRLDVPEVMVHSYVQAFLETISDRLMHGQRVSIQNFGTFKPRVQTSRPVRNPRTGEPLMLEPRVSVRFTPGKSLFERINSCTDLKSDKDSARR